MSISCENKTSDWVSNKTQFIIAWGLPTALLAISGFMNLPAVATGLIWMGALSWMGVACLRNARHCGRMHCFFSGPFFLLFGVLALGVGLQLSILQDLTFNHLGLALIIGTPLVCILPELKWGTYKHQSDKEECRH